MKRWIITISLCLVLGVATSLAIAWVALRSDVLRVRADGVWEGARFLAASEQDVSEEALIETRKQLRRWFDTSASVHVVAMHGRASDVALFAGTVGDELLPSPPWIVQWRAGLPARCLKLELVDHGRITDTTGSSTAPADMHSAFVGAINGDGNPPNDRSLDRAHLPDGFYIESARHLRPDWNGLVIDTLLYAGMWCVVWILVSAVRRSDRLTPNS